MTSAGSWEVIRRDHHTLVAKEGSQLLLIELPGPQETTGRQCRLHVAKAPWSSKLQLDLDPRKDQCKFSKRVIGSSRCAPNFSRLDLSFKGPRDHRRQLYFISILAKTRIPSNRQELNGISTFLRKLPSPRQLEALTEGHVIKCVSRLDSTRLDS